MLFSRRDFFVALGGLSLSGMLPSCNNNPSNAPFSPKFRKLVEASISENKIPGLAISTIRENKLSGVEGFGYANLKSVFMMAPNSVQNIASVSKLVTATAIMQLHERELIGLHQDLSELCGFPVVNPFFPKHKITVENVLSHTSSVQDIRGERRRAYACGPLKKPLAEWVTDYFTHNLTGDAPRQIFKETPPGHSYRYSNMGYALLGYIVERVSKEPFEEYCQKNIFTPVGMKDTSWSFETTPESRRARPYFWASKSDGVGYYSGLEEFLIPPHTPTEDELGKNLPVCWFSDNARPASLCWTSALDFGVFTKLFLDKSNAGILKSKTIDLMFSSYYSKPQNSAGDLFIQGLGWYQEPRSDGRVIWGHSGDSPGISSLVRIYPEAKAGIALLSNGDEVQDSLRVLADQYFDNFI